MYADLMERVESIDNAGDLHTIGGLVPLIATMGSPHGTLRALAAEVLATCVQVCGLLCCIKRSSISPFNAHRSPNHTNVCCVGRITPRRK